MLWPSFGVLRPWSGSLRVVALCGDPLRLVGWGFCGGSARFGSVRVVGIIVFSRCLFSLNGSDLQPFGINKKKKGQLGVLGRVSV